MLAAGFSAVLNRFPHHESDRRRYRLSGKRGGTQQRPAVVATVPREPVAPGVAATTLRRWLSR
ncbi:uncharacterized protein LOC62_06G008077 [Vanrija pseudolonga]|uniref:Uncharacterized protein n=1 Tax=Vanrija pseudolonga TaxID=143232 RepID=A0AAF0YGF4_9TREE|nr:hypothetical protein LOC62_06G008077 [Vanrija pseudolonga]